MIGFTLDKMQSYRQTKAVGFEKGAGESEETRARMVWVREELEEVWREEIEKL